MRVLHYLTRFLWGRGVFDEAIGAVEQLSKHRGIKMLGRKPCPRVAGEGTDRQKPIDMMDGECEMENEEWET